MNLETASRDPKAAVRRGGAADGRRTRDNKPLKGTGGTELMAFLKQARDETGKPAVGVWARRFLARGQTDFSFGMEAEGDKKEDEVKVNKAKSLACMWTMEDEVGGICNY